MAQSVIDYLKHVYEHSEETQNGQSSTTQDLAARKGEPPVHSAIVNNLERPDPAEMMNLNFKVTAEFKREFRMYAAAHHLSLVQVLYQAFEALRVQRT